MNFLKNFFRSTRDSLVNFDSYKVTKELPFSSHVGYLYGLFYFVALLTVIPVGIRLIFLSPSLPEKVNQIRESVAQAYPGDLVVSIKNGLLTTNATQPFFYDGPAGILVKEEGQKHLVVIDTAATSSDYSRYESVVLLTKTELVYPGRSAEDQEPEGYQVIPLKEFEDVTLTRQVYANFVRSLEPVWGLIRPGLFVLVSLLVLVVPFIVSGFLVIGQLVYLLILALILQVLGQVLGLKNSYRQVFKILARATTLPALFFLVLGTFHLSPAIPFAYSLILGLFFLAICFQIGKETKG